jgi:hypothetical protein
MIRKIRMRPPLTYEAVSPTARLSAPVKNTLNFARDVTDLYAHTSIAGLKKRSRSQPADQQSMLMGDINIVDNKGTNFQEKVGGPRAAVALTSRAQVASTKFDNQMGIASSTSTGSNILNQSGTTTTINVSAFVLKAGDQSLSYSSGSVNPGAYGAYFVYFDDPFYAGGAVIYKATLDPAVLASALGRVEVGKITTSAGGGGSGGSNGGGGGGRCVLEGTVIEALNNEPMILERHSEEKWCTIVTEHFSLTGSYDHPVFDEHRGMVPISSISIGDYVVTQKGEEKVVNCYTRLLPETKVKVTMARGHLFWANGILSHNKE